MNPEKNTLTEEQLEIEEQSIGEPINVVEQERMIKQRYIPAHELSNEEQDELL